MRSHYVNIISFEGTKPLLPVITESMLSQDRRRMMSLDHSELSNCQEIYQYNDWTKKRFINIFCTRWVRWRKCNCWTWNQTNSMNNLFIISWHRCLMFLVWYLGVIVLSGGTVWVGVFHLFLEGCGGAGCPGNLPSTCSVLYMVYVM